jgi:hypothetical protein
MIELRLKRDHALGLDFERAVETFNFEFESREPVLYLLRISRAVDRGAGVVV